MAVNPRPTSCRPVAGVALATVACGIKKDGTPDLVLIELAAGSTVAGVFTTNAFRAAPVVVAEEHLVSTGGAIRALLVNSGNANAGTGAAGLAHARDHARAVAEALDLPADSVLPFSTGVIGQPLPDAKLRAGIADAAGSLAEDDAAEDDATEDGAAREATWEAAARGIMTTDTVMKLASRSVEIDGRTVTLTGFAKGSGMIQPDMATMLAYVFTDAKLDALGLQVALKSTVDDTFNAITVDSDTSTNDALVLCATGQGVAIESGAPGFAPFVDALRSLSLELAQAIVRDGEGATKFITVRVTGGDSRAECRAVGYAVANSPLVKSAMFASDANVGRLLMAIGKAQLPGLSPSGLGIGLTSRMDADAIVVSVGDVRAFERGTMADGYTEERGAAVLAETEITVTIELGRGEAEASIYTSDLSHEYVSINADYRS